MATSVYSWSTTAGTNATADSSINWAEGQLPSTVNDSARAMMAAIAAMIRDQGGYAATTGSANAYVLALSQTMSSAVPGLVGFRANFTNTGAATLNVDSLGAQPLRAVTGQALVAGDITSGCNYVVTWNSTSSEWLLINPQPNMLKTGGALGTPASGTLTNCTGLPISTGVSGLGTGVATFLATPSSANLASAVTDETGSGALVFGTSPTITSATLVTPALGTPASGTLTNCTGLPTAGLVNGAVTPAKMSQPLTQMTAVSASGTSVDFTGIPSWVTRIEVILNQISMSGTNILYICVGNGSFVYSGYAGSTSLISGGVSTQNISAGFYFYGGSVDTSGGTRSGAFRLRKVSGNIWVGDGTIGWENTTATSLVQGTISLGGALDRVQIIPSGANTFDNGSVTVFYE